MKNTKPWKVVALVTSVGLMGAYVGHRALQASPVSPAVPPADVAPAPEAATPADAWARPPLVEAPPRPREMFAGSKSMVDIVTVEEVEKTLGEAVKPAQKAGTAPSK